MSWHLTHDGTVQRLSAVCAEWSGLAHQLQSLADSEVPDASRLAADLAVASIGGQPVAIGPYVRERAWNAARMLRALSHLMFDRHPGQVNLDSTVLYPLIRAAFEDAATITWLQRPADRSVRLTRGLRALVTESDYFTENLRRLGAAALLRGEVSVEMQNDGAEHLEREHANVLEQYGALANDLGLDINEVTAKLHTSVPISATYSKEGIEFVMWKMLSDLSHFSFITQRHLATTPMSGSSASLLHVTFVTFTETTNRIVRDAVAAFSGALELHHPTERG